MKNKFKFSVKSIIENSIGILTLNAAKKRNPLSLSTLRSLNQHFSEFESQFLKDKKPRVVILNAEGPVFSAGHDLKEINNSSPEQIKDIFDECTQLCLKMKQMPFPIIAQVSGVAAAAGLQLAMSCDLVIATKNSSFSCPGIKLGIFQDLGLFCSTPGVALYETVKSEKKVLELLLTGESIDGDAALKFGLINHLCDQNKIEELTQEIIDKMKVHSAEILAFGKQNFYKMTNQNTLALKYDLTCKVMQENIQKSECQEGLKSFIEKRQPQWNN